MQAIEDAGLTLISDVHASGPVLDQLPSKRYSIAGVRGVALLQIETPTGSLTLLEHRAGREIRYMAI